MLKDPNYKEISVTDMCIMQILKTVQLNYQKIEKKRLDLLREVHVGRSKDQITYHKHSRITLSPRDPIFVKNYRSQERTLKWRMHFDQMLSELKDDKT